MANLSFFLKPNAEKRENKKVIVSERFKDEKGNAIPFEIRPISAGEDEEIRKSCIKKVPVIGRKGTYTQEFDTNVYISKLASVAVVYPDLNNKELQDSYGVMGAEQLVKTMLYNDEFMILAGALSDATDTEEMDDLVADAKN